MQSDIFKYVPENSIQNLETLLNEHTFVLKIVNSRTTKHGDFRVLKNNCYQISINNNLNIYRFLITLLHEIAHLVTYKKYTRIKPHGKEWKNNFKILMLPFLTPAIFPEKILPLLANYLINPKASTDTDNNLSLALKQFDPKNNKNFIYEIDDGDAFLFNGKYFTKLNKRKKRYACIENASKKVYLFNALAEVDKIKEKK